MQDTAVEQVVPSPPIARRTFLQIMRDPDLSCQARVVLAMIHLPLVQDYELRIARAHIANALGYSLKEASRAIKELEDALIIVTEMGRGPGAYKLFRLGPAIVGGDSNNSFIAFEKKASTASEQSIILGYGLRNESTDGPEGWPPGSQQMPLELADAALSRSRAEARGEISTHTRSFVIQATTTTPRARAHEDSSSSSLFEKITRVAPTFSRASFETCLRDFGAARLERQLARLPARIDRENRLGRPVGDTGGLFFKSVIGDWSAPAQPQVRPWQTAHAERQIHAPAVSDAKPDTKPDAGAIAEREHQARKERAMQFLQALPPTERAHIERRADEISRQWPLSLDPAKRDKMASGMLYGVVSRYALTHGVVL